MIMLRHVAAVRDAREVARRACDELAQRLVAANCARDPEVMEILIDELGVGCSELDARLRFLDQRCEETHQELRTQELAKGFGWLDDVVARMQVDAIASTETGELQDGAVEALTAIPIDPSRWYGPRVLRVLEDAATEELADPDLNGSGLPTPLTAAEKEIADQFAILAHELTTAAEEAHGLRRTLPQRLGDPYREDPWYEQGLGDAA